MIALVTSWPCRPATCDRRGLADLVDDVAAGPCRGSTRCDVRIALRCRPAGRPGACEAPSSLLAGGGRRAAQGCRAGGGSRRGVRSVARGARRAGRRHRVGRQPTRWPGWSSDLDERGPQRSQASSSRRSSSRRKTSIGRSVHAVRSASSARSCRATTACDATNSCAASAACAAGSTGSPGCATPTSCMDPLTDAAVANALGAAVSAEQVDERRRPHARPGEGRRPRRADHRRPQDRTRCAGGVGADRPRHAAPRTSTTESVCETSTGEAVPVATIRRLCCDADIVPVVLDGDGVTLDVGRAKRVATREQRRALRAMYRTCAHPGCTVGFDDCDIHHVDPWAARRAHRPGQPAPAVQPPPPPPACHEGGWTPHPASATGASSDADPTEPHFEDPPSTISARHLPDAPPVARGSGDRDRVRPRADSSRDGIAPDRRRPRRRARTGSVELAARREARWLGLGQPPAGRDRRCHGSRTLAARGLPVDRQVDQPPAGSTRRGRSIDPISGHCPVGPRASPRGRDHATTVSRLPVSR